ncbi:MAG: hypothetical protein WC707_02555 [Candidatus Babeliaceae bacterium]
MKRIICIILYCYASLSMTHSYHFQRFVLLEDDKKTIKKCVDFIYDIHFFTKDAAKRSSKKIL